MTVEDYGGSSPKRAALENFEQRDYVGDFLKERIDYDELERLEQQSMTIFERMVEDHPCHLAWSGGIDSLTLLHMAKRLGMDGELEAVTSYSPEYYPSMMELTEVYPREWGFEWVELVNEEYDIEWVANNSDVHLWPAEPAKQRQMDWGFRSSFDEYCKEKGHTVSIWANRNEDNETPYYIGPRAFLNHADQGAPIKDWDTGYVIAYVDKYDLPISPAYHASPSSGGGPWYRRLSQNHGSTIIERPPEAWFSVRKFLIRHGYTFFWERILEYFPDAPDKAAIHAAETDEKMYDIEEGYEMGVDDKQWPPDIPSVS